MRNLLFAFMALLGSVQGHGQNLNYTWQNPFPQGKNIHALYFLNNNLGWAAGAGGAALRTLDGGTNWLYLQVPQSADYHDIRFVNEQQGYLAGSGGMLYTSQNGGQSWSLQPLPVPDDLLSICFIDADSGWIAGANSTIIHTSDRGASWVKTASPPGPSKHLVKILFIDSNRGWVIGNDPSTGNNGTVYRTTNGGTSWEPVLDVNEKLTGLSVPVRDTVIVCGTAGMMLRSNNGGGSWDTLSVPVAGALFDVEFTSTEVGFATCSADFPGPGNFISTRNAGQTWQPEIIGSPGVQLPALHILDPGHLFTGGSGGIMFRTSDGGANWQEMSRGAHETLRAVTFIDELEGWAAGGDNQPLILKTTNAGWEWTPMNLNAASDQLTDISFINPLVGVAVGNQGTILGTNDGGLKWDSLSHGIYPGLRKVHIFPDLVSAIIIGTEGRILVTKNGGREWNPLTSGVTSVLSGLAFPGVHQGWIVGYNNPVLLHSTDRGYTWNQVATGFSVDMHSVAFADTLHGWIGCANGIILRTTDGGTTWSQESTGTSGTINYLRFFDHLRGTGTAGTLRLITVDGGVTWEHDTIGFGCTALGAWFHDLHTCHLVGDDGMVLRYADAFSGIPGGEEESIHLSLFPNPATDRIQVVIPAGLQRDTPLFYSLSDVMGRVVLRGSLNGMQRQFTIPVASIPSGLYLVTLSGSDRPVAPARVQVVR